MLFRSVSSFAFAPAVSGGRGGGFNLGQVLSTHPSLDRRLEQLARISADLGER